MFKMNLEIVSILGCRVIVANIGIYDIPVKCVLKPCRKTVDAIKPSDLGYKILRRAWFTNVDEMDYGVTQKRLIRVAEKFGCTAWITKSIPDNAFGSVLCQQAEP